MSLILHELRPRLLRHHKHCLLSRCSLFQSSTALWSLGVLSFLFLYFHIHLSHTPFSIPYYKALYSTNTSISSTAPPSSTTVHISRSLVFLSLFLHILDHHFNTPTIKLLFHWLHLRFLSLHIPYSSFKLSLLKPFCFSLSYTSIIAFSTSFSIQP